MNRVCIALGGNIGDTESLIKQSLAKMEENGIHPVKVSSLTVTKPYGGVEQDDFLNGACVAETELSPERLLKTLLEIEKELDRVRIIHWGPRTIDLDVIFYEDKIINTDFLKVPHPDMTNRTFVLGPMNEICPEWIHPVNGKTVKELYENLKNKQ